MKNTTKTFEQIAVLAVLLHDEYKDSETAAKLIGFALGAIFATTLISITA